MAFPQHNPLKIPMGLITPRLHRADFALIRSHFMFYLLRSGIILHAGHIVSHSEGKK